MLRVVAGVLVWLMVAVAPGMAQQRAPSQDEPLMGSEDSPAAVTAAPAEAPVATAPAPPGFGGDDGVYRILVIGDGLAGGLGAGMTRMSVGDTRFEIANRYNEFASLMRPAVYDWADAVGKIAAVKPYDAAVILMGTNDRQDWRDGNFRYAFGTPQWTAAYEAQLDRLLEAVKATGMKIYWVALPPFGDPGFDADMQTLAALQKKHVEAKGGVLLDVRAALLAPDGSYTDKGLDENGIERKLRERDGITFFKQGNNRFGILVMNALKAAEHLPDAGGAAAPAQPVPDVAVTPAPPAVAAPDAAGTPVFAQQGLDGNDMSFEAASVREAKAEANPAPGEPHKVIAAATGSKSELLMVQGSVAAPPAGRLDDFSYTPPPAN